MIDPTHPLESRRGAASNAPRGRPGKRCPAPRTWLFDLDDTLHNASAHIFPHIARSMMAYICRFLEVDEREATRLRQLYWGRYGATLLGLMRHHGVDPHHFLHHTHQFDDLPSWVITERGLAPTLSRLPGRKILFSNAPAHYARAVLAIAGIRHRFSAVYSLEGLRFQPKPAIGGFQRLLRAEHLHPANCIMVEDSLQNLKTAKRLGMKTVWVSSQTRLPPFVDARVTSVLDLPRRAAAL